MKSYEQLVTTADKLLLPILSKEQKKITDFAQFLSSIQMVFLTELKIDFISPALSSKYYASSSIQSVYKKNRNKSQAKVHLVSVEMEEIDYSRFRLSLLKDH